jgi:hypothetical protein
MCLCQKINFKLLLIVIFVTILTCGFWTVLFYKHTIIGEVVWDINKIFVSVLAFYCLIKSTVAPRYIDFMKIYIRIIFRVWLLIFITFSMYKGTERIAFLLSISFIFGYLEGLIDIEAWIKTIHQRELKFEFINQLLANRMIASIIFINVIHFTCAIILWTFFRYY